MKFSHFSAKFLIFIAFFLFAVSLVSAQQQGTLNLPRTLDLIQFIKVVSQQTGTVFIYQEKDIRGKMGITQPTNFKASKEDYLALFAKLLEVQGLGMVPQKNKKIIEIVPSRESRYSKLTIRRGKRGIGENSEHEIRILPIQYADMNKVRATLAPLFSKTGVILTYAPANTLIIVDSQINIKRLVDVIRFLDVPKVGPLEPIMTVYQPRFSQAKDLHKTINSIFANAERSGRKQQLRMIIDDRLNQLILIATKEYTQEILSFLAQIDVSLEDIGAMLTVRELRFASSSRLASLLTNIFGKNPPRFNKIHRQSQSVLQKPQQETSTVEQTESSTEYSAQQAISQNPMLSEGETTEEKKEVPVPFPPVDEIQLEEKQNSTPTPTFAPPNVGVRIVAFDTLNALMIIANKEMTKEILALVDQLDVARGDVQLKLHPLKFASAKVISPLISSIFTDNVVSGQDKGQAAPGSRVKIIPETRLNALIIIADAFTAERIINLVEELDVGQGDSELTLFPLQFSSADTVASLLKEIFSTKSLSEKGKETLTPDNAVKIIPEKRLNSLIIIAGKHDTQKVIALVKRIDVEEGDSTLTIHRLRYAPVKDVGELLNSVYSKINSGKDGKNPQNVLIIPNARLNALILFANEAQRKQILEFVSALDIQTGNDGSNFKLYTLKYAVAEDVAKLLQDLTKNIQELSSSASTSPETASQVVPTTTSKEETEISISADDATNSLLVFGAPEIFPTLDGIITKLDVRRLQVYAEVLIMEVSLDKSLDLGIKFNQVIGSNTDSGEFNEIGAIGTGPKAGNTQTAPFTGNDDNFLGIVGGPSIALDTDGDGTTDNTYFSFGAFIKATQTDTEINVLANPQILMVNNEEANINVSSVVPVSTKTITDSNGQTSEQFEFRDVGIILKVKPQISGEDSIRLVIEGQSSNISASQGVSSSTQKAITTFKREFTTTVVTRDDDIVVLGGLINDRISTSKTKTPGLADLPLIGWLFKSNSSKNEKTNLLVFIRPKIIRSQQDLIAVTQKANDRFKAVNENPADREVLLNDLEKSVDRVQ